MEKHLWNIPLNKYFTPLMAQRKRKKEDLMENCALDNNDVGEKGKSWSFLCTVHCRVTELCLPSWLPRYGRCQTARSLHQLTPGSMHFPPGCSQANVHYFCMEGSDMKIHSDQFFCFCSSRWQSSWKIATVAWNSNRSFISRRLIKKCKSNMTGQ